MARKDQDKNKEYQSKWYESNKQLQMERTKASKQKKKEWYEEYKKTLKCNECGEEDYRCVDIYRLEKSEDNRSIAEMVRRNLSTEKIISEISKCKILCSNCHNKLKK